MRLAAAITMFAAGSVFAMELPVEKQITHAPYGHVLTNTSVWSHDGRWLVYDVRSADNVFDGTRIERVNVDTGSVEVLYESRNGAKCAVASFHPTEAKVVFLEGPEDPSDDWNYGPSRRHGRWLQTDQPGRAHNLDAMNYAPPFAQGALRGGSHLHVFSPDGLWVASTYEDEILVRAERAGLAGAQKINAMSWCPCRQSVPCTWRLHIPVIATEIIFPWP
ncbi:MAG: DUF3748 domain-containing protein [Magnetospirillum sp.]|nr:DUF3748 domain-containing protein [Magnetospirillum sp.]